MSRKGEKATPHAGHFKKGHAGGPGRAPRKKEDRYLLRISKKVTDEEWDKIILRAIKDAKAGDSRARDWLSKYLVSEKQTLDVHHSSEPLIILKAPSNGRNRTE